MGDNLCCSDANKNNQSIIVYIFIIKIPYILYS